MKISYQLGNKDYKGIDIAKYLLAFLVVAGHTHPFKNIDNPIFLQLWNSMLLLVVPYFFMAAGFFLFSKVYKTQDKTHQLATIWGYLKKVCRLYIYWTIVFLPITIWDFAHNGLPLHKDIILFIRGTFLFGENYYSWPLWFLLSMIYSIAFIYLLTLLNQKVETIFWISIGVFLIAITFNYLVTGESENRYLLALGKAIKYLFLTGRLFTGMFYLMVGGLISINKIRLSNLVMVLLVIIAVSFQFFQIDIISPLLFSLLPITLFYVTINLKWEGVKNSIFLRKCSTVLYFTHMIVFFLYTIIFKKFTYFGWDAFLVSVLIPIMLTPLIMRYEDKFPILKDLFG